MVGRFLGRPVDQGVGTPSREGLMEARDRSPGAEPDEPAGVAPHDAASPSVAGRAALWPAALAAGLIAGVAAWLIGEAAHDFFAPAEVATIRMGQQTKGPTFETENEAT